ncbi:MAG: T9SS type A sorting domain-containing protein, partial [Fimbriimonadaceae bacterium]|nr:T9SS type A sorting domain-containing protein [Chitinophagales bacterium]
FTLIDETAGISVFNAAEDFGYTVTEGDELNVIGTIAQFNGLTQIIPDTMILLSEDNILIDTLLVDDLNETTESSYIYIDGLEFIEPSQWLGDGSSFDVELTNGSSNFVMRIDNNTDLSTISYADLTEGSDLFLLTVTGIGIQYDIDLPFNNGYQIIPRYSSDILLNIGHNISSVPDNYYLLYPNPTTDNLTINSKEIIQSVEIINQLGEIVNVVEINAMQKTIDVQQLPAGYYFLKLKTASGVYSSDFIKQ